MSSYDVIAAPVLITLLLYYAFRGLSALLTLPWRWRKLSGGDVLGIIVLAFCSIIVMARIHELSTRIANTKHANLIYNLTGQIEQYAHEQKRYPFPETDAGTYTTFVSTNNTYQACVYSLSDGTVLKIADETNIFHWLNISIPCLLEKRISPSYLQVACLANETHGVQGYAIGGFDDGNGLSRGFNYAVLGIAFPDVVVSEKSGEKGFRLKATWHGEHKRQTPDKGIFRFGYGEGDSICPLFPPEMFSPTNTITKIHGTSPDCVEYWVKKLQVKPNGNRWEIDLPLK